MLYLTGQHTLYARPAEPLLAGIPDVRPRDPQRGQHSLLRCDSQYVSGTCQLHLERHTVSDR